jgi:cytochrome c-type biogenesis protein CcmH
MMPFILVAALLSLTATAFIAWPLLRARAGAPRAARTALLAGLVLLVGGGAIYAWLGNGALARGAVEGESNQIISTLARHLEHDPGDAPGWINLGQAYGAIGNYSLALRCYQRANRLSAGGSAPALEGMAEAMLMGGDSSQAEKAGELLERALQIDPNSPKALFYSAVSAYQQGHLQLARQRFAAMVALGPPESVRTALQHQIDEIDAQLRSEAPGPGAAGPVPAAGVSDQATAIHLHVTIAPALAAKVPADAALFVFVRAPSGGPPLAVKRSILALPQDVELSAADSMVAGRTVRPGQDVAVVARISASGSPLPQSGDLFGEIHTVAGKSGPQALQIDKLNP